MVNRLNSPHAEGLSRTLQHTAQDACLEIPPGHVGPYWLAGSGRLVWWTGRVAIGLRHEVRSHDEAQAQSARWVQRLYLDRRGDALLN